MENRSALKKFEDWHPTDERFKQLKQSVIVFARNPKLPITYKETTELRPEDLLELSQEANRLPVSDQPLSPEILPETPVIGKQTPDWIKRGHQAVVSAAT